jgi:predicted transcriptional regulator
LSVIIKEENMACVSPDGKPTESGTKMLRALQARLGSPEEIAKHTGLPLFRVRSGLRELTQAGIAIERDGKHELTEKGAKLIG